MQLDLSKAEVGTFEKLPTRQRPAGAGKKSELLERVRKLPTKGVLRIPLPTDSNKESIKELVASVNSCLQRRGALTFKPRVHVNSDTKRVEIYRDANSDWAMKDGDFVLSNTNRRLTVGDEQK